MTAKEIRNIPDRVPGTVGLRKGQSISPDVATLLVRIEIAAQLAELNENLKRINYIRVDE